ncbi:MAG: SIMPL domain-containing protein [Lachnospiraceae bacterium]|nr:SIMPL domain-containing protein [Lachnospiraceae bacterium]
MRKRLFTLGAVCALLFTACGRAAGAVQTTGTGASNVTAKTTAEAAGTQAASGTDRSAEAGVMNRDWAEEDAEAERIQIENTDSQVITVTSRETVKVVPDMAEVVYAVTTQQKDAAACQEENSQKVAQLAETLKALGVEEKSIQTSGYDMNPRYDWDKNGEIVGYEAATQVTVSDLPLDQVGTILSKSVESGVNQIQSVVYLSSRYDESYQEALKQAVGQAQEKAQALADASGCTLGRAVRITEHSDSQSARYDAPVNRLAMKEASMADMTVMPGEVDVEASISVDFAIQ